MHGTMSLKFVLCTVLVWRSPEFRTKHVAAWLELIETNKYSFWRLHSSNTHSYSMQWSPSWESNRFSVSQEIPRILWDPKLHHRIHKRNAVWTFRNMMRFLQWGVVSTSPNTQAGGPPFVGCPRLLIRYIRGRPPYRRPFLHPQPDEAPCRGDGDPLIAEMCTSNIYTLRDVCRNNR